MKDLDKLSALHKIMLFQAATMSGLAILLIPGAETSQADARMDAANVLNELSERIRKEFVSDDK